MRNFARPRPAPSSSAVVLGAEAGPQIHVSSAVVKLGSAAAAQAVVLGTAYRAAENTLITAIGAFATLVGADSVVLPATKAGGTTLATAVTAFLDASTALNGFLSTVVKTT